MAEHDIKGDKLQINQILSKEEVKIAINTILTYTEGFTLDDFDLVYKKYLDDIIESLDLDGGGGGPSQEGLVNVGTVTQNEADVTLSDLWRWKIATVFYEKSTPQIFPITLPDAGNTRIDTIVGNTSNEFQYIQGVQTTGAAVAPNIPIGTVPLVSVFSNDSGIERFEEFAISAFVRYDISTQNLTVAQKRNALKNIGAVNDFEFAAKYGVLEIRHDDHQGKILLSPGGGINVISQTGILRGMMRMEANSAGLGSINAMLYVRSALDGTTRTVVTFANHLGEYIFSILNNGTSNFSKHAPTHPDAITPDQSATLGQVLGLIEGGGGGTGFVTLDTSQTITGLKEFDQSVPTKQGFHIESNTAIFRKIGYASINFNSSGNRFILSRPDEVDAHFILDNLTELRTFTLPNASGTILLEENGSLLNNEEFEGDGETTPYSIQKDAVPTEGSPRFLTSGAIFNAFQNIDATLPQVIKDSILGFEPVFRAAKYDDGAYTFLKVFFTGNAFIATNTNAGNRIYYSKDGIFFYPLSTPFSMIPTGIAKKGDTILMCGYNSGTDQNIIRSNDNGLTWEGVDTPAGVSLQDIAVMENRWFVVDSNGTTDSVLYSDNDGTTWTASTTSANATNLRGIVVANGKVIASSYAGTDRLQVSSDKGVTFTGIAGSYGGGSWGKGKLFKGRTVFISTAGSGNKLVWSDNLTAWTSVSNGANAVGLRGIEQIGEYLYTTDALGNIRRSLDALTWEYYGNISDGSVNDIAGGYINNSPVMVAVASTGTRIHTSVKLI